jgi:hypothetical protein
MKKFSRYIGQIKHTCLISSVLFTAGTLQAQFNSGNLTVFQAGDGAASLANTGNPIVLKEYSPAGIQTYSMIVPNTSTNALVVSGSATSEGFLSLSADKKYLVFGGYAQSLPNATSLAGSTAATINRGIGMVANGGLSSYSLIATSASFFTSNNIRGAAATDNTNCWGSGANQGTNYFGTASAPTNVQNTKVNLRAIAVFNNQLYASSQVASGTPTDIGVYSIGVGTPTAAGQTASTVINTGVGSQPAQFYFNTAGNICYVADQRNAAGGGIQKWVYSSNTWTLAYTLPTGTTTIGATGVVADFSGANPIVYATTNESSSNRLISIIDAGAPSTATTLATASTANTVFRGLAFSPCAAPTLTPSSNTNFCANQTLSLNVSSTGGGPYTYSWTGSGVFSATTIANPTVTNATTGIYTVSATNGCGSTSATLAVNVNPLPAINVNSITICTGQPASLTASGANTYIWNTGSTSSSITVSPTANTQYSVIGTSSAGCVSTATTQVIVTNSPSITVNSGTICSGKSATLIANGVNSFTWNTGASTNSIVVSPSVTTTYTVSGNLAGCPGSSSNTANVAVIPSPTLAIIGNLVTCSNTPAVLTASGATTYSWSNGSTSASISVSPSVTTVYSVIGTNTNGCSESLTSTITVSGAPVLTISATATTICVGETVSLTASGANSYSWSNGNSSSLTAVSPTSTSNYTLTGTIGSNCSSTKQISINVNACTGITNNDFAPATFMFQNPASEDLVIYFNQTGNKTLQLINSFGESVYTASTDEKNIQIKICSFARGIYFIQVSSQNQKNIKKLILE